MKHSVTTEEGTGNQAIVLTAEDFEEAVQLKDLKAQVEGNGVELEVKKMAAVLKIPLRLRAQYVKGGKGKKDKTEEKDETPAEKPETQPFNSGIGHTDTEPG